MNELKKSPQFHFFRYALLGALDHECEDVDTLLPDRVRASFKKSLKEFSKDADTIHVQQEKAKLNRLAAPNSEKPDPLSLQLTHRFRYLVEEGLHLSTQRWSLAFEKGSTDFSSSEMDIRDLEPYLEKEISQSDDQIEKFYPSSLHADRFCDYIRKQSLMSLKDFLPIEEKKTSATLIHSMPEQNPQPALLATCIACHESGVAPRLEFSKSNQLSRLLNTKKYPRGFLIDEILFRLSSQAGPSRMPLNQVISPEEELELKNYFTKLSQESNRQ